MATFNRPTNTYKPELSDIIEGPNAGANPAIVVVNRDNPVMPTSISGGGAGAVASVNGDTGTVVLTADDVGAVPQGGPLSTALDTDGKAIENTNLVLLGVSTSASEGVPAITSIVSITLDDFDSLNPPDANTLYVVIPDE
jgi:hypothetical protein